jgi:alanyl-tRNA synthetase
MKIGAAAQFGEKYGAVVRVVSVDRYSNEFCGGTHVDNAGQIGAFKVISEAGVAAGVRRIEAITGSGLVDRIRQAEGTVSHVAEQLKTTADGLPNRIAVLLEESRVMRKALEETKEKELGSSVNALMETAITKNGVQLLTAKFDGYDVNELRMLSDKVKEGRGSLVIVLASVAGDKVTFIVTVTDDLLEKGYHAGNMIKKIAAAAGGGGGGKADMAQAGAKDPSKIDEAFAIAASLL